MKCDECGNEVLKSEPEKAFNLTINGVKETLIPCSMIKFHVVKEGTFCDPCYEQKINKKEIDYINNLK